MHKMKKHIAVAVTVALMAFPLSPVLANESTSDNPVVVASIGDQETTVAVAAEAPVSAYEAGPLTSLEEVAAAEGLKAAADTAVAAVDDVAARTAFELRVVARAATIATAKTALQVYVAEVAVVAYEAGSLTTLDQVAIAEGLKAAAVTKVTVVADEATKTALELRITNRATTIATAKTPLQLQAAEAAVVAYEAGSLTTLAEVTTAEGLKAAAVEAVAVVADEATKTALELRITTRATAIATAKTAQETPVVDQNGNTVISSTWFTELIGKIQLALTFDPVRKCELNERHALAKLAQAQQLMKDGKIEAAQISVDQYTDKIAKAQAFLDQIEDPTSETAKALDKALVNVNANNIVVLGNLLDKLPEQAAQKLALNVVRTMEKAVNKIEKEEAKIGDPITTQVTTADTEKKYLEKHAKVALAELKKSISEKGKFHIEDQDNEKIDGVNKFTIEDSKQNVKIQSQVTDETVNSVKKPTTPSLRTSDNHKDDRNKQEDRNKDKGQDKGQDNRWDHK